jgi:serine/threonine protein kinase
VPQTVRANDPSAPLLGRTTVLTVSQRVTARADRPTSEGERELSSGLAVAGGSIVLPSLRPEERLLLGLVDGRLSVARLAHLSGLSEEATTRALASLCRRRILVPVEAPEVTIRGKSTETLFRLGPYDVLSKLGQGGMGTVYLGRRTGAIGFRRLVAVKVVRQDSGLESAAERSFVREVEVGSLLEHPNVQSVVDVGTYQNHPFLVLQYVEGRDLEEICFGRRVRPDVVAAVVLDALRGLQRSHLLVNAAGQWLGLVHADVSSPNIIVGFDGVSRLTDFGSARFTALGESGKADPMNLGKPAFLAPEQILSEPLDARADVFAMGIVMWTALTGQALFSADSYDQIAAKVLGMPIPAPSAYGAPACFDEICLRALSREREGRYPSADHMAQALLAAAVPAGLLATASTIGAYVRAEVGASEPVSNVVSPSISPMAPLRAAPATVAAPLANAASQTLTKTIVIPGRDSRRLVADKTPSRRALNVSIWLTIGFVTVTLAVVWAKHLVKVGRPHAAVTATAAKQGSTAN